MSVRRPPTELPGRPVSPLEMPRALYAWMSASDDRAVRAVSSGEIVLINGDASWRRYASLTAAEASIP